MIAYAHSRNSAGQRQELAQHLEAVAELAAEFCSSFGARQVGYLLGQWHDLGKFHPDFQRYLLAAEAGTRLPHGPDHKAAGAHLAAQSLGMLAMIVQGHHGGLASLADFKSWVRDPGKRAAITTALQVARQVYPHLEPAGSISLPAHALRDPLAAEFLLRLLFSALVDADYLDTERHFAASTAAQRGARVSLEQMWACFQQDQAAISGHRQDTVSQVRHAIYSACLQAAQCPSGLFRLTVPTGGGKTRSALAFALQHALLHGQQRIIVAIPFISITEQTADVYRRIFELLPVLLEHHSGAIRPAEEATAPEATWAQLAAENWDAPLIVTTTVQLFESLFANGPARMRKLHRLAHSVIILDEAQTLPPHRLTPILDALRQLCAHYGTTVVLSTATQPAFEAIPAFADIDATEIVPQPQVYFEQLKRVEYEWHTDPPLTWSQVAARMAAEPQALAILNTKADTLALLDALAECGVEDAFHLSTLLCGKHRRKVIAQVRQRLAEGRPCHLVSTQVVEAGVDLDFPLVLRALGPLDAIIQAAGRCNREGKLSVGRVIVFQPEEGGLPPGAYRVGTAVAKSLLGGGDLDLHAAHTARLYFEQLFRTLDTDSDGIQRLRCSFDYPEVARQFRMIEQDTESVVVRYGTEEQQRNLEAILDQLRAHSPQARFLLRQLQPYLVGLYRRKADEYRRQGLIAPIAPGLSEWLGDYHPVRGLVGEDLRPDDLVV